MIVDILWLVTGVMVVAASLLTFVGFFTDNLDVSEAGALIAMAALVPALIALVIWTLGGGLW